MTFRSLFELFLAHRRSRDVWKPAEANLGRDRRVFQRVPVKISYRMRNRVYGLETDGVLGNLSLGGAGFVAAVNWPEGSPVHLTIEKYGFDVDAQIVFRTPAGEQFLYGAKFQSISIRKLLKLRRILLDPYEGSLAIS